MKITFKRFNNQYIVTINGYTHTLATSKEAWQIIMNTRYVDSKLKILYDMCVLPRGKHKKEAVKQWLLSYPSEVAIDNAIHDIITGKYILEEILQRKGYLQ